MRPLIVPRLTRAAIAAAVAGWAGMIALVSSVLAVAVGQPFDTVRDLALALMTVAIAPMMLGSYELGGVTPLWPSRVSLAAGITACLVYGLLQALAIADPTLAAPILADVATVVVGGWLVGAPLLAGPWLRGSLRILGALSGLGFVLVGLGLLVGGPLGPLAWLGLVGSIFLFPQWALRMARVFSSAAAPTASPTPVPLPDPAS